MTDDLVERWFASELMKNARLREAWDNRLRSEQHWRRADKLIEDLTRGLMKFLKSQPDSGGHGGSKRGLIGSRLCERKKEAGNWVKTMSSRNQMRMSREQ